MKAGRLLEHYCEMTPGVRAALLATVDSFLKQGARWGTGMRTNRTLIQLHAFSNFRDKALLIPKVIDQAIQFVFGLRGRPGPA